MQYRNDTPPILAGIVYRRHDPVDELLERVRSGLTARGIIVGGISQNKIDSPDNASRSMLVVREINGAWEVPILQFRGEEARGCRLNPQAIADIAGRMNTIMAADTDLLLINRFGRAESESRGLRDLFEHAALSGLPLLVAVREDYCDAWRDFHGGLGTELPVSEEAVIYWWEAVHRNRTGSTGANAGC